MPSKPPDDTRLASLMTVDGAGLAVPLADDFGELLTHQLDVSAHGRPAATGSRATMRGVLTSKRPNIDLLRARRDFGKSMRNAKEQALPPEVGTAIYLAAVSVARSRLDQRITSLSDEELRRSLGWASRSHGSPRS